MKKKRLPKTDSLFFCYQCELRVEKNLFIVCKYLKINEIYAKKIG
jgi:hypothetical protein